MVLEDGKEHLDYLLQKSFCYEHHLKNYEESLKTGLIPNGWRIKKSAAITPVMEDFHRKWQQILYDAEKNLVELLLYEAYQVVAEMMQMQMQKLERSVQRTMIKSIRILNRNVINTGRRWKLKDQRNGKM